MFSGGPGSGVYVSRDGGSTWKRLEGHGLPKPPVGKIDVAVAAKDSKRVYALIQTADQGSLWRSDDGGDNWKVGSWQRALIGRAGYYIRLAVSPANPDEVLVANSSFHQSIDGGKSFRTLPWGGDTHDIWIDPTNADRILVTDDGGMYMTDRPRQDLAAHHAAHRPDVPRRRGQRRPLPHLQQHAGRRHHARPQHDARSRARASGGRRVRRVRARRRGPSTGVWEHGLGGCESGFTIPDPTDPNIVWATCYGNEVTRYDHRTKLARSVSPWLHTLDSAPEQGASTAPTGRRRWPSTRSTTTRSTTAARSSSRRRTAARAGRVISPDLSTQDPRRIVSSGGIVGDNLGQFYGEVVFAIAPSEVQKGLIWAGTNDGKVWFTNDGGGDAGTTSRRTSPGLPPWGAVSKIEPSHFDAGTAYIAVDFHLMDNRDPCIYKTTDFGQTWTKITDDLPKGPLAYARVIAENPNRKGMLFAGTGNALYYSLDDGAHWNRLKDGLPPAPVSWIVVQKQAHDLVVSTYGRGLYILEDITPLEQGAVERARTPAVRPLRAAPRLPPGPGRTGPDHYVLERRPRIRVQVEILDQAGTVIRKLPPAAGAGRAQPRLLGPALRSAAPGRAPDDASRKSAYLGRAALPSAKTRPITHWGVVPGPGPDRPRRARTPCGSPWTARARPSLSRSSCRPTATRTEADIQASVKLQLRVRDDISAVADMTNRSNGCAGRSKTREDARRQKGKGLRPQGAGGDSTRRCRTSNTA